MTQLTQQQKVIKLMAKHTEKEWWLPQDFMQPNLGDLFVGYEASARLSELAKDYPDMIQTLPAGKYKKRRIRWETISEWYYGIDKSLREVLMDQGIYAQQPLPPMSDDSVVKPIQEKLL